MTAQRLLNNFASSELGQVQTMASHKSRDEINDNNQIPPSYSNWPQARA